LIDKRVVALVAVLVVLDAVSTYLCTLYYSIELEFNPLLRYLLKIYGRVALALYAPLEFMLLATLLSVYTRILKRIGIRDTFKYCVVVLSVFYFIVALNFGCLISR
jgi:hypothetical protein